MQQPHNLSGGPTAPRHYLDRELPHGEIHWWQPTYREFICSRSTLTWLQTEGMKAIDGKPVMVLEKAEMGGGNVAAQWEYIEDEPQAWVQPCER